MRAQQTPEPAIEAGIDRRWSLRPWDSPMRQSQSEPTLGFDLQTRLRRAWLLQVETTVAIGGKEAEPIKFADLRRKQMHPAQLGQIAAKTKTRTEIRRIGNGTWQPRPIQDASDDQ
jgi:hypothetical protein